MSARTVAVERITKKERKLQETVQHSIEFGADVCSLRVMEQLLPKKAFQNLQNASDGKEKLDPANADLIAAALKDWAMKAGATHFTHWFQPLTGAAAEKHDSFLKWSGSGKVIEAFSGKDLLRGEPDASSFPSGGLRTTHQARGYTTWDPASSPFLWRGTHGVTLCIPSLFFSWTGFALDHKIPLLRSNEKIQSAAMRLLKLCDIPASRVVSTLGPEQEYFLIDRRLFLLRADLLLSGRTVFGAKSPKGQELEDHYFGPIKDRVMSFMKEFEARAVRLGIPIKTRHNEVAPSQYEIAPIFESASDAVDHNLLLMELMRQVAMEHDLVCLFHEKPFQGLNGSGKHCNWSLATDTGLNLLDPKENSLLFLVLLTAILRAVHDHAGLMRASIASIGNDYRLGGSEAPPTILSVYLGDRLELLIDHLIQEKPIPQDVSKTIDLGLSHISQHLADATDRNRTSFFAFTGNKFEFRAVGASAHPAFPVTVLNAIIANSLNLILDEMEDIIKGRKLTEPEILKETLPCLCRHLRLSRGVLFNGNAYTVEWEKEAERRSLPNIRKSFAAFSQMLEAKTKRAFQNILSDVELHSLYEVSVERYVKLMQIESNLMIELFRTQILPTALLDQKNRAESVKSLINLGISPATPLLESIQHLADCIEASILAIDEIEKIQTQSVDFGWEAKAKVYSEILSQKIEIARNHVDKLETLVDNALWPMPKYREMLFII